MNKKIYIMGIALLTACALPSFAQVSNDNEDQVNKIDSRWAMNDYVPGQVLVKFKDANRIQVRRAQGRFASTDAERVTAVLQKYGTDEMEQLLPHEKPNRQLHRGKAFNGEDIQERDLSQLYCLKLSAKHQHETMELIDELNALDEVEYAEPDYYCYIMGGETIAESYGTNPMARQQWYLDAYGVTELWDKPIVNAERPVIAIIDTGVDTTHPDLAANCIAGYDFVNNTPNVIDDNMHGTHVAGIAAACNNEIGVVGANPKAWIMPVKVLNKNGRGTTSTILRGVQYAVENGAKILNLSLGGYGYSKAATDVYRNASLSAIIVAAAGNDGKCVYASHAGLTKHGITPAPSFPGAYSFVLGVQATTQDGNIAAFSNFDDDGPLFSCESSLNEPDGFNYELKAPGVQIMSTLPGGGYGILQGTSMASPLVAGSISALLMVKDYASQQQLWAELLHTNNIAEAYALTELPADLEVVRVMLRERKEFAEETEDAFSGINDVKAGETVSIYPVVRCTAGEASNITLKIETDDNEDPNCVEIVTSEICFGWHLDAMGKATSKNPLVIKIPEGIADSRHIRMKITVSCDEQTGTNSQSIRFLAINAHTVSGTIEEDMTLTADRVHYIDDDITISEGITLTIEPGTRIEFAANKGIKSSGKLVARGTAEKPIVFTSRNVGELWSGVSTRIKRRISSFNQSLYMNSDTTLFTIYPTDATPINVSNGFSKTPYYNPTNETKSDKAFNLKDYMEDWDDTEIFSIKGDEPFLTDPNYITPAMLRMLADWKQYLATFGSGERSATNTKWVRISAVPFYYTSYNDYGDTITYCRFEDSRMDCDWNNYSYPYMENCLIQRCSYREAFYGITGVRNVLTENSASERSVLPWEKKSFWNVVNNENHVYERGSGSLCSYSMLKDNNYFNNPAILSASGGNAIYNGNEYWLISNSSTPTIESAKKPSYLGTSREDIVRPHIYELGNAPDTTWSTLDLSNMRTTPVSEAHGIVWKVLVNGKDAQDEYETLAPLGVGRHKFEVYFNRPMNKAVAPQVSFGLRDPWTQNAVNEDAFWNEEGTIYTAYKTITGKTSSDGINRIYVHGAEDDEFFPCPYEKTRFKINVQAAGSMATGFAAEASMGRVNLTWDNSGNDFEDAMGYNLYRFCKEEEMDTIRINSNILGLETSEYIDYDVTPNHTYYYWYKVLSTDLVEYDVSNVVAATPRTAMLGDANGNGDVDVVDVVTTVDYALGKEPSPFVFDAADVNIDQNIDVLDVIGIVQKILYPNSSSVAAMANETLAVYTIENGILYVESPVALAGVQVQLSLNEELEMKNEVFVTAVDLGGFERTSAWLSENDYLFLAYSMNGKTLMPGKHELLYIGDSEVSSIRLADDNGRHVKVVAGEELTNMAVMGARVKRQNGVYDLFGRKIVNSQSSNCQLPHGVYIINGQKVVK